jgi:hypothetical protein
MNEEIETETAPKTHTSKVPGLEPGTHAARVMRRNGAGNNGFDRHANDGIHEIGCGNNKNEKRKVLHVIQMYTELLRISDQIRIVCERVRNVSKVS